MKDLAQKLLAIFQVEYKEHLTGIRTILGTIELQEGTFAGHSLDEAFRRAHSLKGAARAVGFAVVENVSHLLEGAFAKIRSGGVAFHPSMMAVFHLALDSLEDLVVALAAGKTPAEPVQVLAALKNLSEGKAPAAAASLREESPTVAPVAPQTRQATDTLRVDTKTIEHILELSDQLMTEGIRQDAVSRDLSHLVREFTRVNRERAMVREQSNAQFRRLAAAPEYSGVVSYINYLEHQILSLDAECRSLARSQSRGAWNLRQTAADLHEAAERACMVPAESLYEGFGKMVRDLARSQDKEVRYEVRGLETVADRRVLELLKDPVMHMLRNAVDHAIEPPAQRRARSKPSAGSIRLTFKAESGRLLLTVEDDGSGLDVDKIADVAHRGESAGKPDEVIKRIFEPGFSTSTSVTDLSGRGMGLSVVQESVRRLQGSVEAHNNAAGGATFAVSAPLAIFSQHLVLLTCAGQPFAVAASLVEHLFRVEAGSGLETVEGKRVFKTGDHTMPVFLLAELLGLEVTPENRRYVPLAVVNIAGRRAALIVDSFLSHREAVVQDVCRSPIFGRKAAGAILLEDGAVAVVLDLPGILQGGAAISPIPAGGSDRVSATSPEQMPSILVVDDSMTTRALEKIILEAHGYRVTIAVNGVEALEMLQKIAVDLVITDLEMPLMDGFSLIQEIKKQPQFSKIPIIIVSSLEKREDQERGLFLGADAYIVKRSFEQQELLEAIRQVV